MKQCKPCITIRDILVILRNNAVEFYKNTKRDIKAYSRINAAVCVLDQPVTPKTLDGEMALIKKIREQAVGNYDASVSSRTD